MWWESAADTVWRHLTDRPHQHPKCRSQRWVWPVASSFITGRRWRYGNTECWNAGIFIQLFGITCIQTPAPAIHTPRQRLVARWPICWGYWVTMERYGQLVKACSAQHTQHIQQAWDGPVAANQSFPELRVMWTNWPDFLLRHSGDWLHAPPITIPLVCQTRLSG